jgi:hypothetical protein
MGEGGIHAWNTVEMALSGRESPSHPLMLGGISVNTWQERYRKRPHSPYESEVKFLAGSSLQGWKWLCLKSKSLEIIGNKGNALGGKSPILLIRTVLASAYLENGGVRTNEDTICT